MNRCGHSKHAQYCSEECAIEAHDLAHPNDPAEYWGECSICAERVEGEIDEGKRTPNGDLIVEVEPKAIDKAIDADAFPDK